MEGAYLDDGVDIQRSVDVGEPVVDLIGAVDARRVDREQHERRRDVGVEVVGTPSTW